MTFLYYAHSGLRYLVLIAGVVALVYFAVAFFAKRPAQRADRIIMSSFVGFLDLQILLGLLLVIGGIFYPMVIGHLLMMALAAVTAHLSAIKAKRALDFRVAHQIRLVGTLITLGLIVAGIAAIGRGIFESRAPMIGIGL